MIKISTDKIDKTLRLLDYWYPIRSTVYVKILEGYDCVEAPDGSRGFAVYVPQEKTFYIPTDVEEVEEGAVIHCIAHEYKHAMQDAEGKHFDEEEAEQFAVKIEELYKKTGDHFFEWIKEMVYSDQVVLYPDKKEKMRKVEEALGFRLFTWQQTKVFVGSYRRSGKTTADILDMLLNNETILMRRPINPREEFEQVELENICNRLNAANIKTARFKKVGKRCTSRPDTTYDEGEETF